ncbi:unnamed protein product [Pleuronectes platessa]|uniref:Cilia- and flagella-associated protein 299 n=1 Tax=Pleuronectes platessa TaxID=8262 RepID=A0A9N7YQ45_PLEPL|nr:unnamed protein product [Pleuronectes platessa]
MAPPESSVIYRHLSSLYSFYNWKTQVSVSNSSPNFEVLYEDPNGLLFKNKRDKKILSVDPSFPPHCVSDVISLYGSIFTGARLNSWRKTTSLIRTPTSAFESGPGEDSIRTFLQTDLHVHVVIYDHNIRTV